MKKARLLPVMGRLLPLLAFALIAAESFTLVFEARDLLREAGQREAAGAEAVAGFFLEAHPEEEAALAAALRDGEALAAYRLAGKSRLAKYGFGETERAGRYDELESGWRKRILLIAGVCFGAGLLAGLLAHMRHTARSKRLREVLDAYLDEDYRFAASLEPLFGGRRTGADGLLDDSLRRLGGMIRQRSSRLLDERESTKALVTDISHQLKTPIASLKTCFSLYLEAEDDAERDEFLARSRLQMDKLEELTGALISISRMETAMIELRPEPTDLSEMLVRAVNGVYDKARKKGIELELAPFDDVSLRLDERWTAEAVMNVLDNAVKYSPAGTAVRISVETRTSFVRVEIADEGIGVPKELRPRIFQRFYRADHPLVRASEGSGVGLYLARMILEKQGGGISVKPGGKVGSVFVAQLPRPSRLSP